MGYLFLAFTLISLPGFLYYRMKLELGFGVSVFAGFAAGMFVLWIVDCTLGLLSLPKIVYKGIQKTKNGSIDRES